MTSIKRKFGFTKTVFLVGVCIGCAFLIRYYFFSHLPASELSGVRGRFQEKIPEKNSIMWHAVQAGLTNYTLQTNTSIDFTLHPSLIDEQWANENNLLSGHISIQSDWKKSQTYSGIENVGFVIDSMIVGLIDEKEEILVDIHAKLSVHTTVTKRYLRIDSITIEQTGKKIDSIVLRDLLLHKFLNTRIEMNPEKNNILALFSPDTFPKLIEDNAQKVRLLSTEHQAGTLFSLSGEQLSLSGYRMDPTNYETHISIPTYNLIIDEKSTQVPEISSIRVRQENEYIGSFDGVSNYLFTNKKQQQTISGDLLFPGGIWAYIIHTREIIPLKNFNPPSIPSKTIKREEVKNNLLEQKKQDISIN